MITEHRKKIEEEKARKIKLIEAFHQETGRFPKQVEKYQGEAIGAFLSSISLGYTCITEDQMNQLLELGFVMQKKKSEREHKVRLIEQFYKENGRLPKREESYQGEMLGRFLNNIKFGYSFVTEDQMERLTVLGFDRRIKNKQEEKEYQINLIEEFYQENGRLPKVREQYRGVAIGIILRDIRSEKRTVTEKQMNRLLKLGFVKHIREKEKERKINLLEQFYQEKRRLPKREEVYQGEMLEKFLNHIKSGKISITEDQMERLTVLGFDRTIQYKQEKKEQKIKLIEEFHRENGRLPKVKEQYCEVAIGTCLKGIKSGKISITEEQMERLIILGFESKINDEIIGKKVEQIEKFYKETGRLPEQDESLSREKPKVGEFLLSIKIGKIRITEKQFLRLQQMDATLTKEQVKFIEKPKTKVKK